MKIEDVKAGDRLLCTAAIEGCWHPNELILVRQCSCCDALFIVCYHGHKIGLEELGPAHLERLEIVKVSA